MYKCTECGCEYEIKPDYCDCGNNEFTIVVEENPIMDKSSLNTDDEDNISNNEIVNNFDNNKNSFIEHESTKFNSPDITFDLGSILIFTFCIIMSIIVILFCWNPKEIATTETSNHITKTLNIPTNIDSFWNNSTEGIIVGNEQKTKQQDIEISQKQIPLTNPQKTTTLVTKPIKKEDLTQKNIKQTTSTQIKKMENKAPQQKTPQQTSIKPTTTQQVQKSTNTATTQKPITTAQSIQKETTTTNTNTATTTATSNNNYKDSAIAKQELANYKINLRNTIGKKIDFTKVVGDGNCAISFKIASNGKIINRAFATQSQNITLNDAVYAAIMATPTFNPPPLAYNDETLYLYIKFYDGNFSISLK